MKIFLLSLRKQVYNVVFICFVRSFFRAHDVVNTLARVPLKVQAVINGLMAAFFIMAPFLFRKQNRKRALNILLYIFSSFTLKKLAMTTSLPFWRKNITNVVILSSLPLTRITIALFLSIAFVSFAQAQATLISDRADYPPGDTVTLFGGDFLPGETVTLQVLHYGVDGDNDTSAAHRPWTVIADTNGDFTTTWIVPAEEDRSGAKFLATAGGKTSLLNAETTFSDAVDANDGNVHLAKLSTNFIGEPGEIKIEKLVINY